MPNFQELQDQQQQRQAVRDEATSKAAEPTPININIQVPDSASLEAPEQYLRSLEAKLSNGMRIKMARPNEALIFRLGRIYGVTAKEDISINSAKALCYITEINGEQLKLPNNKVDLITLGNRLGDDGVDEVTLLYFQNFAPKDNLPGLKKNL